MGSFHSNWRKLDLFVGHLVLVLHCIPLTGRVEGLKLQIFTSVTHCPGKEEGAY